MRSSLAGDVVRERFERQWAIQAVTDKPDSHASRPCPIVTLIPKLIQMVNSRPQASPEEMKQSFLQVVNDGAFAEESGDLVADEDFTRELEFQAALMVEVIQDVHDDLAREGRWPEPIGSDAYVG